jgi:hypothetical protein
MKSLCLILFLGLSMPGCSMLTKSGRQNRAYSKYIKQMKTARERQRSRVIHQRAEMPPLRTSAPLQESAQTSESQ